MSGGSFGYAYHHLSDMIQALKEDKLVYRRAFAKHLELVATAMHDVEWVDSCDYGPGDDKESIMACISNGALLAAAVDEAKETVKTLNDILKTVNG